EGLPKLPAQNVMTVAALAVTDLALSGSSCGIASVPDTCSTVPFFEATADRFLPTEFITKVPLPRGRHVRSETMPATITGLSTARRINQKNDCNRVRWKHFSKAQR